ncbi:ESX secretion-associated protein EspG [Umezawaea endophytica]|uniref:ESX secretion-associated protein EspG n=1 Tax=Umezawaea endophytica TaxID=1654476 RepID=A0A9X2VTW3_9PSEU|nr:ESX secretion-associated protein EspG [Umezawaea endophytica]MCS7482718.1 ESX secretion-associated protein EspG [Umezawaea endophytica]
MTRFVLSRLEYDLCWEHLRLGEHPTALTVAAHGATVDERRELFHHTWKSMSHQGLVDRTELHPDLVAHLRALARPEVEVDARLRLDPTGPRSKALGAVVHRHAVVATLTAEHLILDAADPDGLATAVVGLLPPAPAPRSRSITLPADVLDRAATAADESPTRFETVLREGGLTSQDARQVVSVLGGVVAMGQFGAAHRPLRHGHPGPRRRGPYVVSFYDTPDGRWQFTRRRGWATLAPADHARLTTAVNELLAETTQE